MYKTHLRFVSLVIFLFFIQTLAAQKTNVYGFVKDQNNQVVEGLSVEYKRFGSVTDAKGFYSLSVPSGKKINLVLLKLH